MGPGPRDRLFYSLLKPTTTSFYYHYPTTAASITRPSPSYNSCYYYYIIYYVYILYVYIDILVHSFNNFHKKIHAFFFGSRYTHLAL